VALGGGARNICVIVRYYHMYKAGIGQDRAYPLTPAFKEAFPAGSSVHNTHHNYVTHILNVCTIYLAYTWGSPEPYIYTPYIW